MAARHCGLSDTFVGACTSVRTNLGTESPSPTTSLIFLRPVQQLQNMIVVFRMKFSEAAEGAKIVTSDM